MPSPVNPFKQALAQQRRQIGFWLMLGNSSAAEICAGAGFDWIVIDAEHAPNDENTILAQLQALGSCPGTHPVVRTPTGLGQAGQVWIKRVLDLGAQTLLVPMIDTPEQAAAVVRAARYPQADGRGGTRGMAPTRAARWGRWADYAQVANDRLCVIVQAETRRAMAHLDAIAAVDGVDAVFLGPADLSADMGHVGQPGHPDVEAQMQQAIARIRAAGKAAGSIAADPATARRYLDWGVSFVAVGIDAHLLVRGVDQLAAHFISDTP